MKITRKKHGYTLRCNDTEFQALQQIVLVSDVLATHGVKVLSGRAAAAHSRAQSQNGSFLAVTDDKRI